MNFQSYFEKLANSEEFKKFKSDNSEHYLCSGFFSIDKRGNDNQQHLDFYIPSEKKTFSFKIEKDFEIIKLEEFKEFIPEKINERINFDFEDIEEMIEKKMKRKKIDKEIQKLLFSIQNNGKGHFLVGTIFISGMGVLKITIDLEKKMITNFENKSFFDMIKIVSK